MATAAVTMTMATHNPRARAPLRVCAAWDMNPGAATVATPKPSKAKAKPPPPPATTTPARPPPLTHADLFARSSEAQGRSDSFSFGVQLYARRHFFFPPLSINEYNKRVMDVVKCESQDLLLNKLLGEDFLTEEERDILRWGRNIVSSKTRTRKRAGIAVYNRASSLETLVCNTLTLYWISLPHKFQTVGTTDVSIGLHKWCLITAYCRRAALKFPENNPRFGHTSTTCNTVNRSEV
ncbi:Ribonuclease III family protein [Zea mays]|uniref:Ribonuclease III family protein n=1 Tax=Zea mays TaxID=4577 RepID=A0A1D6MHG2_MAIZE|nr:Ribonuclease III family protein [Zea mays]